MKCQECERDFGVAVVPEFGYYPQASECYLTFTCYDCYVKASNAGFEGWVFDDCLKKHVGWDKDFLGSLDEEVCRWSFFIVLEKGHYPTPITYEGLLIKIEDSEGQLDFWGPFAIANGELALVLAHLHLLPSE